MSESSIKFRNSLKGKMLFFGIFPTIFILLVIIFFFTVNNFSTARHNNEEMIKKVADKVAGEIERGNRNAITTVQAMAFAQENGLFGKRIESNAYARKILEEFPEFTGSYFGYEPDADQSDQSFLNSDQSKLIPKALDSKGRFIPYWFNGKQESNKHLLFLEPLVDMETSLYYNGVKNLFLNAGKALPMVTEPYVYEGKMIVEQTFPIIIGGKFKGIAGVDRALKDIFNFIKSIRDRESVDIFLISRLGKIISATTDQEKLLKTKVIGETPYSELFSRYYTSRDSRFFEVIEDPIDKQRYYFTTALVPTGNWTVILRKPEADVLNPIWKEFYFSLAFALSGMLLIGGLLIWLSKSISNRIKHAVTTANHLALGELPDDTQLDTSINDEVGQMNKSFTRVMQVYQDITNVCVALAEGDYSKTIEKKSDEDALAEAINLMTRKRKKAEEELALKNKELEKRNYLIERELVVAREIQMSMLPTNFPPYPDHQELSLYAKLNPAREVGGDFYDFFFMGENQFGVCVGDVSGKGTPSALFMAATKALIKSISGNEVSPGSILSYANEELSRENEICMFVTVFLVVLDLKSGKFIYTNAGHNPPYIKRANGEVSCLDKRHGPIVGVEGEIKYGEDKDVLSRGDQLFLYTDGVTEAFNINGALFSDKRLENLLSSEKYESAEKMVNSIYSEVKKFEDGVHQSDDITILSLQYDGCVKSLGTDSFKITIKNQLEEIQHVFSRLEEFVGNAKLQKKITGKIKTVFDELLSNIIKYGYQDTDEHEINIEVDAIESQIKIQIIDDGVAFNPFEASAPDINASLEVREIGGLGIYITQNIMDDCQYQRLGDKNIVTLVKHLDGQGAIK